MTAFEVVATCLAVALIVWTAGYSYGCHEEREYWARVGRPPLPKVKR